MKNLCILLFILLTLFIIFYVKKYKEKYEKILKEKQKRNLSVKEEEELMDIFRILKAYREVDEVPAEMLKSSFSGQIDLVLNQLDTLLKK